MISQTEYYSYRSLLVQQPEAILALEQFYMDFLVQVTFNAAADLYHDFDNSNDLLPFWIGYQPRQRGRAPSGTAIPWSEVGEKSLSSNILRALTKSEMNITFPGLPFGGDIRFATHDALIHFDIKMTGPNDRADEIVAPPQQISGDGALWENGMLSNSYRVQGKRATINFQPKLPPFYVLQNRVKVCLTYFLKVVYEVQGLGVQPLKYLEVICVPNGLLLFAGPEYAQIPGLLIPGKDDKTTPEHIKRVRVRLNPLAAKDSWRCRQIVKDGLGWAVVPRAFEV